VPNLIPPFSKAQQDNDAGNNQQGNNKNSYSQAYDGGVICYLAGTHGEDHEHYGKYVERKSIFYVHRAKINALSRVDFT
jgi:hypothetical protein